MIFAGAQASIVCLASVGRDRLAGGPGRDTLIGGLGDDLGLAAGGDVLFGIERVR